MKCPLASSFAIKSSFMCLKPELRVVIDIIFKAHITRYSYNIIYCICIYSDKGLPDFANFT